MIKTKQSHRYWVASQPRPDTCKERDLQRMAEGTLSKLKAIGRVAEWYHRPDRAPGRGERAGLPDLLIVPTHDEAPIAIELKTKDGKVTPKQEMWLRSFAPRAALVRGMGELEDCLRHFDLLPVGCKLSPMGRVIEDW